MRMASFQSLATSKPPNVKIQTGNVGFVNRIVVIGLLGDKQHDEKQSSSHQAIATCIVGIPRLHSKKHAFK